MAKTKRRPQKNYEEEDRLRALQDLEMLEKIKTDLLPHLQRAVKQGVTAEEIFRMSEPMLAAKLVTEALRSQDVGKITGAIKEMINRSSGPVKQNDEVTHKFENLPEEQLNAILLQKLNKAKEKNSDENEPIKDRLN